VIRTERFAPPRVVARARRKVGAVAKETYRDDEEKEQHEVQQQHVSAKSFEPDAFVKIFQTDQGEQV
jgi:hypothetical protein